MLTQAEQRKAAKEFSKRWEGLGYEKGHSATFWLELLNEVYGIQRPGDFINFGESSIASDLARVPGTFAD